MEQMVNYLYFMYGYKLKIKVEELMEKMFNRISEMKLLPQSLCLIGLTIVFLFGLFLVIRVSKEMMSLSLNMIKSILNI